MAVSCPNDENFVQFLFCPSLCSVLVSESVPAKKTTGFC